jgi:3-phosphoshikimate 1-carboxyvinyltransferase
MDVKLSLSSNIVNSHISITGSKSETNRLLLLKALYPGISIENSSESDDSIVMIKALAAYEDVIDIHHAGTAMRFLTAYFSLQQGREAVLTGSARMKERPIGILVNALRKLGAQIDYLENEGYPPLKITGITIVQNKVAINAGVSSQYISALLLIGAKMQNGLELTLEGTVTSMPYINMTLSLLSKLGIEYTFNGKVISINPLQDTEPKTIVVESDWSSASYYYSVVALGKEGTQLTLSSYMEGSLQGDSALAKIYEQLGVTTSFNKNNITLTKTNVELHSISLDLNNTPDIAQTIAVTCLGLGISCHLKGLHTLKIKETDRLEALEAEMLKLGAYITVTEDSLHLKASSQLEQNVAINTYNDHRMAMAFAPLALRVPLVIKDAGVVSKSYPTYWKDLEMLGFSVEEV